VFSRVGKSENNSKSGSGGCLDDEVKIRRFDATAPRNDARTHREDEALKMRVKREPTTTRITTRMPESYHQWLIEQAARDFSSINSAMLRLIRQAMQEAAR
jgi:hypothetical protein